jgi:hypothetical protein
MKTNKGIILILVIGLFVYKAQSQNLYYWSGGKKNELKIDSLNLIVKLKSSVVEYNPITKTGENDKIKKVVSLKKDKLCLMNLRKKLNTIELGKLINEHTAYEKIMFAYKLEKQTPIYFTGDILLQPLDGVSIDKIIELSGNAIEVVKKSKHGTFKMSVKNWDNLIKIANKIYESGLVKYCHPNFIAEVLRNQGDPNYGDQYYLNNTGQFGGTNGIDINAPEAWQFSLGLSTVRVAVIDDGVENHEDINGRVLSGFTPTDINGFGTPNDIPPPQDLHIFGHGQACAGIIASTHNEIGIAGIAPCAEIVPVNIFNDWFIQTDYQGNRSIGFAETIDDLVEAIDWAWDEGGADILSNSWGFNTTLIVSDAIVQAINRARSQGRNGLGSIVMNFFQELLFPQMLME